MPATPRRFAVVRPARVCRFAVVRQAVALIVLVLALAACQNEGAIDPRPIVPGTLSEPREVNLIAKDYTFVPAALDLVPGETILLHFVNGGLLIHEAVIGDAAVQDSWELAEAATIGAPPGPTPVVTVPPDTAGLRIVAASGERVDVTWTVPADAAGALSGWVVGCHIPGHWARGMQVPVRWLTGGEGAAPSRADPGAASGAP